MEKEIWKDVKDYSGLYQVSSEGRLRRCGNKLNTWRNKSVRASPEGGYVLTGLNKDKNCKKVNLHRLVAIAFLHNPLCSREVNHINGIKNDNRVENLEWVTSQENTNHYHRLISDKKRGVSKVKGRKNTWRAGITTGGLGNYLGQFKSKSEAYQCFYDTYLEWHGMPPWVW